MLNKTLCLRASLLVLVMGMAAPSFAAAPDAVTSRPSVKIKDPRADMLEVEETDEEEQSTFTEDPLEAEGVVSPLSDDRMQALDQDEEELTVADVDFDTIESYGLLEQSRGEGLGKQFYSNSRRSVMANLIKSMPDSGWHVMQDMGNQVLLTAANAASLKNDVPVDFATGHDLFTLRIEKMLKRGFYREAYALFTRMKVEPYNEKLAILGITSMLINGQKPLACVEMKTFNAPFKKDVFWKEMDAYCVLTLSDEKFPDKQAIINASKYDILKKIIADETFRFPYTPQSFEKLSLFEKALLVAENKLDVSSLNERAYKFVPPEHIQALLNLEDIGNEAKILLGARGVETSVITPNEFAKIYIRMGRKAEKEKTPLTGLAHVSTLYWKRGDTFEPEQRPATIREILQVARTHGYVLLVPFLSELATLTASDGLTLADTHSLVKAALLRGEDIPAQWLDFIRTLPTYSPDDEKTKEISLIAAALLSSDKENSSEKLQEIYDTLKSPKNAFLGHFKNIIENIDNRTGDYAKVQIAYEKGFDTGANKGYIMPAADLMTLLESSRNSRATGEAVLLCNLALRGSEQRMIHVGTIANVVRTLSEVGLGKQAQKLLAEVVLSVKQ